MSTGDWTGIPQRVREWVAVAALQGVAVEAEPDSGPIYRIELSHPIHFPGGPSSLAISMIQWNSIPSSLQVEATFRSGHLRLYIRARPNRWPRIIGIYDYPITLAIFFVPIFRGGRLLTIRAKTRRFGIDTRHRHYCRRTGTLTVVIEHHTIVIPARAIQFAVRKIIRTIRRD